MKIAPRLIAKFIASLLAPSQSSCFHLRILSMGDALIMMAVHTCWEEITFSLAIGVVRTGVVVGTAVVTGAVTEVVTKVTLEVVRGQEEVVEPLREKVELHKIVSRAEVAWELGEGGPKGLVEIAVVFPRRSLVRSSVEEKQGREDKVNWLYCVCFWLEGKSNSCIWLGDGCWVMCGGHSGTTVPPCERLLWRIDFPLFNQGIVIGVNIVNIIDIENIVDRIEVVNTM